MKLTRLCFAAVFVALSSASTALAFFGTYAKATAHSDSFSGTMLTDTDINDLWEPESAVEADAFTSSLVTGGSGAFTALAHVKTGDMSLSVNGIGNGSVGSAEAIGEWRDTFLLDVPGQPQGRQYDVSWAMTATATFEADGGFFAFPQIPGVATHPDLTAGGSVFASASYFNFSDPGAGLLEFAHGSREFSTGENGVDSSDPFPPVSSDIWRLTNGEINSFQLYLDLILRNTGGSAGQDADGNWVTVEGSAFGDMSGSLHWGGIQSVRDAETGELVTDWTLTSESGFDYSKPFPVPEPFTIQLLVALLGCTLIGRRRHHSVHG